MRNDPAIIGPAMVGPAIVGRGGLLCLLSLCVAALLSGCGGGAAPHVQGARQGADRTAPVVKALPPPDSGRPHESGVAPADETRGGQAGPAIGSTVSGKGGQKAQKEEAEKLATEQSKKARESRAERDAARKTTPAAETAPAEQPPAPSKE
jgi:hypothetical protein